MKKDHDDFEELAKQWPDLFQKSGDFEYSIGHGWYNIINTLCYLMSYNLENAKRQLKSALENPDMKFRLSIAEMEDKVKKEKDDLPTFVQIKEKFGSLRVYTDNANNEIGNYITFAECLSGVTCEDCGAPGKSRNDGWIKVLCDEHHGARNKKKRS